jgi:hypothetical protein
VLRPDGTIFFAGVPKDEERPSPGHALISTGGSPSFHEERALCAGEFWVCRDPMGGLTAFCISCGSGHFKPFFDALDTADRPLEQVGVADEKIIHYGGPANARKAARELLVAAGMSISEARALMGPRVPERRLQLHEAL